MINVIQITIEEFKENIYDKYIGLFPQNEQRNWKKIEKTYNEHIESFYKIVMDNKEIGFFMLEKIDSSHPYYLDYFAIYKEYQNKGYGKRALKYLLENIIKTSGLICEIEKEDDNNLTTMKRFDFYKKLGFKKVDSVYSLYDVLYTPIVFLNSPYNKNDIDKLFFDYYKENQGEKDLKERCKIVNE